MISKRRSQEKRKEKCNGKGDGREEMGEEKLKGFFHLHLNQLSTIQEIIEGDKKKKEGRRDSGEQEGQGGRQGGRKKGPRRVNITVLCQANIRCWDTSTKSHRSFGREEDGAREKEWAKMRVCGNKQRHPVKSWEMESESMERQTNSCCC